MTLVEVLTQHLPVWDRTRPGAPEISAAVREPFREIAKHCLQVDAGQRWTVGQILDRLEMDRLGVERQERARQGPTSAQTEKMASAPAISGQRKASAKWPYLLGLAAVVAVVLFLIAKPKPANPPVEVQSTQAQQGGGDEKASTNTDTTKTGTTNADNQGGVVERVMPQVAPSARRTIQGTIKVRVKVEVDAAGNVAKATLESAGPSKYFSRIALEAARDWKFSPAQAGEQPADREWKLQFAFSRARTEVSAVRAKR
jgi:TonB family protein